VIGLAIRGRNRKPQRVLYPGGETRVKQIKYRHVNGFRRTVPRNTNVRRVNPGTIRNRSFLPRISAKTSTSPARSMPRAFRSSGSPGRRKGLVPRSSERRLAGGVPSSSRRARNRFARLRTSPLSGTRVTANARFSRVYSCPARRTVSPESPMPPARAGVSPESLAPPSGAAIFRRELSISRFVPSRTLPHPDGKRQSPPKRNDAPPARTA
jgi:hypothetical protein